MLQAKAGTIVNVGSMSGFIVNKPQEQCYYNASKAAVHHLTKSLAAEWGARGVRVNAVAPTYIETPLNAFVKSNPKMYDAWIGGTPMARLGAGRGDRLGRAVPGLRRGEPDDRQHRSCRWRLHMLVGSRLKLDGERACGRLLSASMSGPRARGPAYSTRPESCSRLARHPITTWHEAGDIVEQSSVRHLERLRGFGARRHGGGRDPRPMPSRASASTRPARWSCSTADGAPVTVSGSGDPQRNVIVWMDHRAIGEAREINDTQDEVLRYVGGSISPEMEMPKLLWLKRHLRASFDAAGHFFDLADFLSWRATGFDCALDVHGDLQVEFPGA